MEDILKSLGENHTDPIAFESADYEEVYGLYTYEGGVSVFRAGMDIDFNDLSDTEKKEVINRFKSKKMVSW